MIPPNDCIRYDTIQSDREVPGNAGALGNADTPSLSLLPGILWPGVVAPGRVLCMGQMQLNCVIMLN